MEYFSLEKYQNKIAKKQNKMEIFERKPRKP